MTIGILTNTYPPDLNGVSVTTGRLVEELGRKGLKVVVATPKNEGVEYPEYVLPLRSFSMPKQFRNDIQVPLFYSSEVADYFRDQGVELIHSQDTWFGGLEAAQIAQDLQIPSIHTYHTYIEAYRTIDIPGYRPFIREFSKRVCNRYDHIIALSSKIYNYLEGLPIETDISQFLNVTNLNHLQQLPFDQELGNKYGIKPDDFVILTFGRVSKEKGLMTALEVVSPLLHSHRQVKYVIAGQGNYSQQLSQQAVALGIESQVVFAGKYTPETLSQWCSLAKFFLFTSLTENLPTTLLEAMYCGLPVVAVDDDSVDYIVQHGQNGYKVPQVELTQVCGDLLLHPDTLTQLAIAARQSAEQLQQRDIAQDYIDLYQRIINTYQPHTRTNLFENYLAGKLETDLDLYREYWLKLWR